jgi:hypothetical protein
MMTTVPEIVTGFATPAIWRKFAKYCGPIASVRLKVVLVPVEKNGRFGNGMAQPAPLVPTTDLL